MIFRKAETNEADAVCRLYDSVKDRGFCAWDGDYPCMDEAQADAAAGCLFVLEDGGALAGAVSVVPENEMDDAGCWQISGNAREFARAVISPRLQGRGLSRLLVDGVTLEIRKTGAAAVHIAVVKTNVPAVKLYKSCGFAFCGEADMYGCSFWLCEKIL